MRVIHVVLAISLLLATVGACAAQMDQPQQQRLWATARAGPPLRPGLSSSGDVLVYGRFAMRIPVSAGGMTSLQRAQFIADRLNQVFAAGMSWRNMRVGLMAGLWTVTADGKLVVTADPRSARAYRMSAAALASRWATRTVIAMGGKPRLIAMQLQPARVRVAGVREELRMNWATSPTKTLSLLNVATGDAIGTAAVAGPADRLDMAKAIALYEYSEDGTIVRAFVPITSTSVTDQLMRAHGVGLVGLPVGTVTTRGLRTGDEVMRMVTDMGDRWNSMINSRLTQWDLQVQAITKVVPLYSMAEKQTVGAAQAVGTSSGVAQTQCVVMSRRDNLMGLSATTSRPPLTGMPATLNDVVVSALIYVPAEAGTLPGGAAPPAPPAPPAE